jgi:DNA-binding Lrp family transcriptional regulator
VRRLKLDKIDRRILCELQRDGRITNVELARRVGLSAPPCLRRVRTLERAGYVHGYYAEVEPKALGYNVTVFAQVGLASQSDIDLEAFERLVQQWPEVRECYMLAGETDFLLRIVAEDWAAYERFLTTRLTTAANVTHVKSALAIRKSKFTPGVPLERSADNGARPADEGAASADGGDGGDGHADDREPSMRRSYT